MEDEISVPRRRKKSGWIAHVIKNENDEGWAVSMTRVGDAEPVLVSPWTMGRDKVNPKPLDHAGFATLLKGAMNVLRRHEDALRARLHRSITCTSDALAVGVHPTKPLAIGSNHDRCHLHHRHHCL